MHDIAVPLTDLERSFLDLARKVAVFAKGFDQETPQATLSRIRLHATINELNEILGTGASENDVERFHSVVVIATQVAEVLAEVSAVVEEREMLAEEHERR